MDRVHARRRLLFSHHVYCHLRVPRARVCNHVFQSFLNGLLHALVEGGGGGFVCGVDVQGARRALGTGTILSGTLCRCARDGAMLASGHQVARDGARAAVQAHPLGGGVIEDERLEGMQVHGAHLARQMRERAERVGGAMLLQPLQHRTLDAHTVRKRL